MRRAILPFISILIIVSVSIVTAQDYNEFLSVFDEGAAAFQKDSMGIAETEFNAAITGFEGLLEGGMIDPTEEAYIKTFLATSYYYVGVIGKSHETLEKASNMFQEALSGMRNEEIYDGKYVSALYYKGMCSFRQYQIANSENAKANLLSSASGDFDVFLQDSVVIAESESYGQKIGFANYLAGYSMYQYGILRTYKPNTRKNAKKALNSAIDYFKAAQDASDERLAIAAILMEGETHYRLARLYGALTPDEWEESDISSMERSAQILAELELARTSTDRMISTAGAHTDLRNFGKMSNYGNDVYSGSAGEQELLATTMRELLDLKLGADFENQRLIRFSDAQLINYTKYTGNSNATKSAMNSVVSFYSGAMYWTAWVEYIEGNYEQAGGLFDRYLMQIGSPRTYHQGIIVADAKFRNAECIFWSAVSSGSIPLINEAKSTYEALNNPQGTYNRYLSNDIKDLIQIRLALINIEGRLSGIQSRQDFNYVIQDAGQTSPENLIDIARYFLEKGIRATGSISQTALKFAGYALDEVLNNASSASFQNRAKFMKGVGTVKLATTYKEKGEKEKTLQEARDILAGCSGEYRDEAQYVEAISYYIGNQNDQALPKFNALVSKGHMRAAYYKGLLQESCVAKGSIWEKIVVSTPDSRPVHVRANNAKNLLDCAGSIPKQTAYGNVKENPPMTYENLVDEEADKRNKKLQALTMWQILTKDKLTPDVDKLVTDKPPETTVEIKFVINPKGGNEELMIDGESEFVQSDGQSQYKATIMQGKHGITVSKKGFYFYEAEIDVNRSTTIEINLNKAVRYTEGKAIAQAANPMAIASGGENLFVANNNTKQIMHIGPDGSVKTKIDYDDLGVITVTALAVDNDLLIVSDSRHNVVKLCDFKGENADFIALGNEPYDGKKLNNPSGIAAAAGKYYIIDSSNRRVLLFDGGTYRRSFGEEELVKPIAINVDEEAQRVYVTDVIKSAVCIFDFGGVLLETKELDEIQTPSHIYKDEDGYFYIADFAANKVAKYSEGFEYLSTASDALTSPRGLTLVGLGPEATMYVATKNNVSVLKGGWDNQYSPE
ncbi:MAG: 6-bladed beta-propeller [Candidatus Zixiibacteriota bacterium]